MNNDAEQDAPFPEEPVTLRTVADAAGVHVSTVSRALRRASVPGGSRRAAEADARIVALAKQLGYTPNPNAASMTTRRSQAFGVLVPHLTDFVLSRIYDAIEGSATAAGYDTFVSNTHDDPGEQQRRTDLLVARRVDGLILGDAHLDGAVLTRLQRRGMPFVLVSRRSPGHLSVCGDDYRGGYLVGQHLAAIGHTRVGVVAAAPHASTSADRLAGCRDALSEAGIELEPELVVELGFDAHEGHEGGRRLLALRRPPTAVFAVNDESAVGVMGALRAAGLRAGSDVAVAGYNDIPLAAELPIPLTTVRSPLREMGVRSVETLRSVVHGLPASSTTLPVELVVRESTLG